MKMTEDNRMIEAISSCATGDTQDVSDAAILAVSLTLTPELWEHVAKQFPAYKPRSFTTVAQMNLLLSSILKLLRGE